MACSTSQEKAANPAVSERERKRKRYFRSRCVSLPSLLPTHGHGKYYVLTPSSPPKLVPASLKYPHISALSAVHWSVRTHEGFIRSFISNALYAPGAKQHAAWKRLGQQNRTILIVTATQDPIIAPEELKPDVMELLEGAEAKVEWRSVEGAHNISDTAPEEIVDHICGFWGI